MSGLPPPPNPYNFYSWLPSDAAFSNEALAVLDACCLSILGYDIICHLNFDLERIKEIRFNRATLSRASTWYLVSRCLTFLACLVGTAFEFIRANGRCSASWTVFSIFYALGNATNSLLLGLRVVAFWKENEWVLWCLGLLWTFVLALDTSIAWAARGFAYRIGDQQVGCIIGDIIQANGVNINIMGWIGTMAYDLICLSLVLYKLWSADGQVVRSHKAQPWDLPTTQPSPTRFITPFLRRQTLIIYGVSWSASLAFIIVQINPGQKIDLIASICFAVPFLVLQNCLICYMFRSLFNFTSKELAKSSKQPAALPLVGGADGGGASGRPGLVGGYGPSSSFESRFNGHGEWSTMPKIASSASTASPSLLQAGGCSSNAFSSTKRHSHSSGSGSSPPPLVSAQLARESWEPGTAVSTMRPCSRQHQPLQSCLVDDSQDGTSVFRIMQTRDVDVALPSSARLA